MQKKHTCWFFIISLVITIYSCDTKINLTTEWKETSVIYGILNPVDSANYIKVYKAFLGEGDAYEMALVYDSLYHKDSLQVKLSEMDNSNLIREIILTVDYSVPKNPGTFSNPNQILYKIPQNIAINSKYKYKLEVSKKNNASIIASSETQIVDDFTITKPGALDKVSWTSQKEYQPYPVKWNSAKDGKRYELIMRFHYAEIDKITNDTIKTDSLEWKIFSGIKSEKTDGSESLIYEIEGEGFYNFINTRLSANSSVKRKAGTLDFIFYVADNEFNTYIDITNAQSGLVQTQIKPEYTNISGGLGIFASRYTKIIKGKKMTDLSIDSLACGEITEHLGFMRADSSLFCN